MALKKYHGWIVQKIFQVSPSRGQAGGPPLCRSLPVAIQSLGLPPGAQEEPPCLCG